VAERDLTAGVGQVHREYKISSLLNDSVMKVISGITKASIARRKLVLEELFLIRQANLD